MLGSDQQHPPDDFVIEAQLEFDRILGPGFLIRAKTKSTMRVFPQDHIEVRHTGKSACRAMANILAIDLELPRFHFADNRKQDGRTAAPPRRIATPQVVGAAPVLQSDQLGPQAADPCPDVAVGDGYFFDAHGPCTCSASTVADAGLYRRHGRHQNPADDDLHAAARSGDGAGLPARCRHCKPRKVSVTLSPASRASQEQTMPSESPNEPLDLQQFLEAAEAAVDDGERVLTWTTSWRSRKPGSWRTTSR